MGVFRMLVSSLRFEGHGRCGLGWLIADTGYPVLASHSSSKFYVFIRPKTRSCSHCLHNDRHAADLA